MGSLSHGIYYGSSIAFVVHSLDPSLFVQLILFSRLVSVDRLLFPLILTTRAR